MSWKLPSVLCAAALVAGCSKGDAQQARVDAGKAPAAISAATLQVAPKPVPVAFEAVGRTEGSREIQVRARVAGILEQQLYAEGDTVKPGAPLFRLERAPFEIELAQARGALAQERARRELAEQESERLKSLADRRAISQKEADQAASTVKQSAAAMQMAEARVRQAELNLSYTSIEAPIGGITGRAQQSIGALVSPGSDASLLTTITRADPVWVRFALSEEEFARLRSSENKAPEVRIEFPDGRAYGAAGKLNFAGSTVDASLGTVQMRAEFANPSLDVLPGQYVKVRVIAGQRPGLLVPQTAVLQNQGGRFVWVLGAESKAEVRQVKVGPWVGKDWLILDGLKPGDTVIVDNLIRLRPGVQVQAKQAS